MDQPVHPSRPPCGWESTIPVFCAAAPRVVVLRLRDFVRDAGPEQVRAWDASVPWLQRECGAVVRGQARAGDYTAILEYELPRDFRRPDVIVLEGGIVVVLELKSGAAVRPAAIDQVRAYARDLEAYHVACEGRPVHAVLVPEGAGPAPRRVDGVYVVGPEGVHALLLELAAAGGGPPIPTAEFLRPDAYAPLPILVQAARDLFEHGDLPIIRRARAATEPALAALSAIVHEAERTRTRHLSLLSGVPGAGKTLVGLQLVHARWLDDLSVPRAGRRAVPAVFLSGNGPLVQVLQDALKSAGGGGRVFVQDVKKYVTTYQRRDDLVPPEHVLVFDEAQRAWDARKMADKHEDAGGLSEPGHLLRFAERIPGWAVVVGLIGTGQSIHEGEEGGLALWRRALETAADPAAWTVHAPADLEAPFLGSSLRTRWNPALSLDTEIRFHLTPRVHAFVETVLDRADPGEAARLAGELHRHGHRFLLSRALDTAKAYLRERYAGAPRARFGLLASSKDKELPAFGIDNGFQTTKRLRVGPWYNAGAHEPGSCCRLDAVATEFAAQGLELDSALLAWGADLLFDGVRWDSSRARGYRKGVRVEDPHRLRLNAYRVLLTRGRDGTVVFVPPAPAFDATAAFLLACGFRTIDPDCGPAID